MYIPNTVPLYGDRYPPLAVESAPRSSHTFKVYDAIANAGCPARVDHSYGFQTIWDWFPAMVLDVPAVGPTGYVFPFWSQYATTVSDVGCTLVSVLSTGERTRAR